MGIISWIVLGAIAGTVARLVLRLIMPTLSVGGIGTTITLGIVGAVLGGVTFNSLLGISFAFNLLSIFVSIVGAVVVLATYGLVMARLRPSRGARSAGNVSRDDVVVGEQAPPLAGKSQNRYDLFISYRRQHGAETARLLREALKDQNLHAFLDVDDLRAGHFDRALLMRVADAPNFVVVLTSHALDRCVEERDWLRQEIAQAIKTNRNIVPLMMPGFQFPEPQELPEDIRALRTYQSVGYSHEFFDAMVDRLARYLR